MPCDEPLTPLSTSVPGPAVSTVAFCGLLRAAVNEICPGLSAVQWTTITWSTGLAKTARLNFTPPAV